jgi:CubicO group peptidase (beta-lactamase class C family)
MTNIESTTFTTDHESKPEDMKPDAMGLGLSTPPHPRGRQRWSRVARNTLVAAASCCALVILAPGAEAGLFSNVLDLDEVSWASVRDLSSSAFHDDFVARSNAGYMLLDIEVDEVDGNQRVAGVWQRNTDGRGWESRRNLTDTQFSDAWQDLSRRGYLLIDQESYTLGGARYYAGIWIQNREGLGWASYRNVTSAEFSDRFNTYRDLGYIPIDVEAYPYGNGLRYSAIWVENAENLGWVLRRDMSSAEFSTYFDQYADTYRVDDFESYRSDYIQRYAAIWIENTNHRGWKVRRDLTAESFGDWWLRYKDEGYRLTDFELYPYSSGYRYAGVWRQNTVRPSWQHRAEVDALLEQAMNDFDIPGMSAVVARDGELQYVRGLGHADINDGTIAHGGTIYRLASVAKAVAGVLGLDLEERGLIDLGQDTRFYVPSMPVHHTHQVWHTLTNRSGIGHYDENGSPGFSDHFDTAEEALDFFEDNALEFTPGQSYLYSTHAYTAAGAAFEGALGAPLVEIVESELNQRYGLGTLRAEDRSIPNANRASLYSAANVEISADDLSWKILGGGLESSAVDLARFGNELLDGSILGEDALITLWTPPDAESGYAYGWNTGNDQCARVVAKNGGQPGAASYIRIYPDLGYVIVVLTNRGGGGHDPVQIGRDIGTILLDAECP